MIQLDGNDGSTSEEEDDIDDDDDEDNDNDIDDGENDEEPLNSEDDVSDDEHDDKFETDNVVVCQYDKVSFKEILSCFPFFVQYHISGQCKGEILYVY